MNLYGPMLDTGVILAAVPQMKHSRKPASSLIAMRRSMTTMSRWSASAMMVWRVIPSRKRSADGVCRVPSAIKNMFAPVHSATEPSPIQHQGIGTTLALRCVFGKSCSDVKAAGLCLNRRAARARPPVVGDIQADALHLRFRIEHRRPGPSSHCDVYARTLRPERHHLASTPGKGANVFVSAARQVEDLQFCCLELLNGVRNVHIEQLCRDQQTSRVVSRAKDATFIGALAIEDARPVVQAMGQNMDTRFPPRDARAIQPDEAIAIV
jgi:hypothetical protein